jgi:hypothetical protein
MTKMLAGGLIPREGGTFEVGPNITSDRATGIGYWTSQDIETYLQQGVGPNGRTADGLMGEVVNGGFGSLGFNQLTKADAAAIAAFLKSVPAVRNVPRAPQAPSVAPGASWEAQFTAEHGRPPTAQDIADRQWSLDFQARNGRAPTAADWAAHWLQGQP